MFTGLESTSVPSQPSYLAEEQPSSNSAFENTGAVVDLCSDSEYEVVASSSATPSTAPTNITQPSPTIYNNTGPYATTQHLEALPDPNRSYVGRSPVPGGHNHRAQVSNERLQATTSPAAAVPASSGGPKYDRSSTPRSLLKTNTNFGPGGPLGSRNLRTECVNMMQKAKQKLQVAAAGVSSTPSSFEPQSQPPDHQVYRYPYEKPPGKYASTPLPPVANDGGRLVPMTLTAQPSTAQPTVPHIKALSAISRRSEPAKTPSTVSFDNVSTEMDAIQAALTEDSPRALKTAMAAISAELEKKGTSVEGTIPASLRTAVKGGQAPRNENRSIESTAQLREAGPPKQATTIGEAMNMVSKSPPEKARKFRSDIPLTFEAIPEELRTLMSSWQRAYKRTDMPFAVFQSMIPLVHKSKNDGLPAIYRSQDGQELAVTIHALPKAWFPSELRPTCKYAIIATDPDGQSYIIGRHKEMKKNAAVHGWGIPYCRWTGTFYPNPDGWEDEPSIFKSWDGREANMARKTTAAAALAAQLRPTNETSLEANPNTSASLMMGEFGVLGIAKPAAVKRRNRKAERLHFHKPDLDPNLIFYGLPASLQLLIDPKALAQGKYKLAPEPKVVGMGLESIQEAIGSYAEGGISAVKLVVTL